MKPDNVLRRRSDGALVLVDFHASRNHPCDTEVGLTTAIGTPGFMAPEQLLGRAVPATDIHAAACVAIALLTRKPLHTMLDDAHRLRWSEATLVPPQVKRFLARMLEPSLARRACDAALLAREARRLAESVPHRTKRAVFVAMGIEMTALSLSIGYRAVANTREARPVDVARPVTSVAVHTPAAITDVPERTPLCAISGNCKHIDDGEIADRVRASCGKLDWRDGRRSNDFSLTIGRSRRDMRVGAIGYGPLRDDVYVSEVHVDGIGRQPDRDRNRG